MLSIQYAVEYANYSGHKQRERGKEHYQRMRYGYDKAVRIWCCVDGCAQNRQVQHPPEEDQSLCYQVAVLQDALMILRFLVQNAILENSMLEGFWFRRTTFGSNGLFGARPRR